MYLASYCILINFITSLLNGLIYFVSCKVFIDCKTSHAFAPCQIESCYSLLAGDGRAWKVDARA